MDELADQFTQANATWKRLQEEQRVATRRAVDAHKWKMELEKLLRECVSETDPVKIIDVPGGVVHVQWINGAVGVAIKAKGEATK
jgi:hypothetical protein